MTRFVTKLYEFNYDEISMIINNDFNGHDKTKIC